MSAGDSFARETAAVIEFMISAVFDIVLSRGGVCRDQDSGHFLICCDETIAWQIFNEKIIGADGPDTGKGISLEEFRRLTGAGE